MDCPQNGRMVVVLLRLAGGAGGAYHYERHQPMQGNKMLLRLVGAAGKAAVRRHDHVLQYYAMAAFGWGLLSLWRVEFVETFQSFRRLPTSHREQAPAEK